METVQADLNW